MTPKQTSEVLKIIDSEEKKEMRKLLVLHTIAARGDPKEIQKMVK